MSIGSFVGNVVCGELIILHLGGQCSFYLERPKNKGFEIKKECQT